MRIGVLHPGAMGAVVASAANTSAMWASEGRSKETLARADTYGLIDAGSLEALVDEVDVVVSVCPPHAALEVAHDVKAAGFDGVYIDANAIAPELARKIGARFSHFVDGGIVGPPPTTKGTTRLYLSGEDATSAAALWEDSFLAPIVLEGPAGSASALKMAYAGWTKGSTALLLAIRAYAEAEGVSDALVEEWHRSIPDLPGRLLRTASGTGRKAWRFVGEMEQIAASLESAGLPDGFHTAARNVYARLSDLKPVVSAELADVIGRLLVYED